MARCLDLMLCIFPFEAELYNQSGLRTVFVGHPMIEALGARAERRRAIPIWSDYFPAAAGGKCGRFCPMMLRAAELICDAHPRYAF